MNDNLEFPDDCPLVSIERVALAMIVPEGHSPCKSGCLKFMCPHKSE